MSLLVAVKHLKKIALSFFAGSLLFTLFSGSAAFAVQDMDCLECHRDAQLKQMTATGELRSLCVDPGDWETDVHHKSGMKCVDCHIGMTPFLHPKEGAARVSCEQCHPMQSEENQLNLHNRVAETAGRSLPECYDCHTKHAVKTKNDPGSAIAGKNIGKTCFSCHGEKTVSKFAAFSPTNVILGHRKCDTRETFDVKVCINCHGDAGHGVGTGYPDYCVTCHNPKKKANFLSAFHSCSSWREQPFRFIMGNVILFCGWALVAGVFVVLLVLIGRFYIARKKQGK